MALYTIVWRVCRGFTLEEELTKVGAEERFDNQRTNASTIRIPIDVDAADYIRFVEVFDGDENEHVKLGAELNSPKQDLIERPYEALIQSNNSAAYASSALEMINEAIQAYSTLPDEMTKIYSISTLASAVMLLVVFIAITMKHRTDDCEPDCYCVAGSCYMQ